MNIMAFDPGLSGAMAVINDHGILMEPFPVIGGFLNLSAISAWASSNLTLDTRAYLEHVHAVYGSSAAGTFTFGRGMGSLEGLLTGLGISYELVQPKTWQREIHRGIEGKLTAKEKSRMAAARLFPQYDFRASEKCRKPHDGMIDAVLIAEYGKRVTK